jgi:hypothetical protein
MNALHSRTHPFFKRDEPESKAIKRSGVKQTTWGQYEAFLDTNVKVVKKKIDPLSFDTTGEMDAAGMPPPMATPPMTMASLLALKKKIMAQYDSGAGAGIQ